MIRLRRPAFFYVAAALAVPLVLAACHGGGGGPVLPQEQASTLVRTAGGKIQHVVIIVQENRSLNNLFYGFPGADTVSFGYDSKNQKIALRPIGLATRWDLAHYSSGYYAACNGVGSIRGTDCRMNGFDLQRCKLQCPKNAPYSYVPHNETAPYLDMAHQYVLADEMFASNFDASSFGSLQYIIEAQDHGTIGYPSGLPGCGGGPNDWIKTIGGGRIHPCFNNTTLGDELDSARLSWAYYESGGTYGRCGNGSDRADHALAYGMWIAYWAIKHICYGPDWNNDIISPPRQFLTDVKDGQLRTVSWVTSTYQNSDKAGSDSATGPSWVASLVNAVGQSKYWNSTAIFIFWDSYGGWYDPEPPKYVDYEGLGFRVPLLIISPYAKQGYVSHVHYEHCSILKFMEDQFGLGRLAACDQRADSPAKDAFNFDAAPRKFIPIR